jgi:uncharacterized membrane protein YsdA (DUF1294 family)
MPRRKSRRTDIRITFAIATLAGGLLLYLAIRPALGWRWYAAWLLNWSVVALILYAFDKLQAQRGEARVLRVPEVVLLGAALIGGFPGAWIGVLLLRHKTRHQVFWTVLIVSTLGHAVLAYFFLR